MLGSLLTTKLYFPPVRAGLVPRPRLLERLQTGLQGPLTLISAPAGSGKTTLLSEWRAGSGSRYPLAWLSLDAADNDPTRFFHHLVASLDLLHPGLLAEVLPLLQSPEMLRPETILTPLINSLNGVPQDFLLVLDDYHVIETASIHAGLVFLLDHLPVCMHIVLLTRSDPPLPLARMRGRGHLTEIRTEHLRFNLDETAQFLNTVMGLNVTPGQVAALEKRTEGWIAGLQLAALSMQGREDLDKFIPAFTGSNHYIVDYLGEEVLSRQPESLREFLLKTSILERLTGSLCDAITGGENSDEVLQGLEHANLFVIPLDKDQCWYRYHHLLTDLLQSRLSHSHPESLPLLHGRASGWFEKNGLIDEAIDHALAGGDFPNAARLFCMESPGVIYNRPITTLERWLQAFPEAFLHEDPRLCVAKAHMLWSMGRREQMTPWITWARQGLASQAAANPEMASNSESLVLLGETYAFESLQLQDDPDRAVDLAKKAINLIPKTARNRVYALGSLYVAYQLTGDTDKTIEVSYEAVALARELNYPSMFATAVYTLCQFLVVKGRLHEAERVAKEALDSAESRGLAGLFYIGLIHIALAETCYEWNELGEMEAHIERGMALLRQGGANILLVNGWFALLRLHLFRRDYQKVLETIDNMERECKDMERNLVQEEVVLLKLRCQAGRGDLSGLAAWVEKEERDAARKMDGGRFSHLNMAAHFLILLNRVKDARQILDGLEAFAERLGHTGWWILVLVQQALAWQKEQQMAHALAALEKALALAQPEGQVHPFVFANEGPEMPELLRIAHQRGIFPDFTARLLSAFTALPAVPVAGSAGAKPGLLSKREIELLELIAAGCSNKEIASRLVISLGTVKRHTVNIFNKLDVKNRTEAVARARELELL